MSHNIFFSAETLGGEYPFTCRANLKKHLDSKIIKTLNVGNVSNFVRQYEITSIYSISVPDEKSAFTERH